VAQFKCRSQLRFAPLVASSVSSSRNPPNSFCVSSRKELSSDLGGAEDEAEEDEDEEDEDS